MSTALLDQDFGSESGDDNFDPAPVEESDKEGEADEEVSSKLAVNGAPQRRRTSGEELNGARSPENEVNGGDDDQGEEETNGGANDEEEEEDDDDEEIIGRPRKKARRDPRNQYLDVEAEVDEDEEDVDEEDEEGQGEGFIADTHPDDEAELPAGAETDDRRHRELDRQREQAQQMDAEKQAEILRERYGRSRTSANDTAKVPKRLLLPGVDDPSIWAVKCKQGKEKEIVFAINKRVEEWARGKTPCPIISAFERHAMSQYLYVEARKQANVFTALDGISNVYPRTKMLLVPIKEMPDLLRVIKNKALPLGSYVRLKRGKYKDDLAQVDDFEPNAHTASLRIVPRLDYGLNEDNKAPMVDGNIKGAAKKRGRSAAFGLNNAAHRPPQRLFNDSEAKKKEAKFLESITIMGKKGWRFRGETYIEGYLVKDFKINYIQTEDVDPKLEEVTMFASGAADGTENLDLAVLAESIKNTSSTKSYQPGDTVEVYDGEQKGVVGKAITIHEDIVTLRVTEGDLRGQNIEVPTKGLRKRFKEGDHVKVIGGSKYRDEIGMVVKIQADTVTILSDLSVQEVTVFSKDLREASDAQIAGGLGRYDLHDLVQLDPATVGCVTKVDRESMRVLDQNGSVKSVLPSQISNRLERRRFAVATDRNGSEIRNDDTVREVGGEQRKGVILHIYRSYLFIHDREQTENSGISVVRASNILTVAAKGGRVAQANAGPDLTKMNPALQRNGTTGNGAMAPPRNFGRDRAIGQTITIRKGPYKGLLGMVKETNDTEARIELHSKAKTISVPKETLSFKDPITGQSMDYTRLNGFRGGRGGAQGGFGGAMVSRIPDGSRTPAGIPQGGRTPAWGMASGSRTPAYGSSSARTPAWQQNGMSGGRTPAYGGGGGGGGGATVNPYDGSRTAYGAGGFAGGRTPAWDPGNRTSYGGSTANDPFSASRTPAYEPSSRTPAYTASYNHDPYAAFGQSNHSAPNDPRNSRTAYDAPTPAAAPTPTNGAYSAPTPAAAAATPYGGEVETPYTGQPETPGWGGDADGPRYEEGTPSP